MMRKIINVAAWELVFLGQGVACAETAAPAQESMTLIEIYRAGGWLMYPITLMSVAAVALVVYFLSVLRAQQIVPESWLHQLQRELSAGRLDEARSLCEAKSSPVAALAAVALDYLKASGKTDPVLLKEVIESEGQRQAARLQNQVQWLLDIGVITPMMGLLGTVVGMLQAFNAVALDIAKARPMALAAGVSLALITTAAGLVVAIPSMMAYAYFRNRVAALVARLETAAMDILAWLTR